VYMIVDLYNTNKTKQTQTTCTTQSVNRICPLSNTT